MSIADLFVRYEQIKAIKSAPERRLMISIHLVDEDDPPNSLPRKRREAVGFLIRKCKEAQFGYNQTIVEVSNFFCLEDRVIRRAMSRFKCFDK